MMDNGWGWNHMDSGAGIFMVVLYVIVLVDLVLLGTWLFKQIIKNYHSK